MKRIVGVILLLISSIYYCCPYVCSAIYLNDYKTEYSNEIFNQGLKWIGGRFQILSVVFGVAGVLYLIWAEIKDK